MRAVVTCAAAVFRSKRYGYDGGVVAVNPPAARLGRENAILWGRGRREYRVHSFAGPLSVKSMVRGTGHWRAGTSSFTLDATSYLILNSGQSYSLEIDSPAPVETFCVFFAHGFVEDAYRAATTADSCLLDDPFTSKRVGFSERLRAGDDAVCAGLRRLRAEPSEGSLWALAEAVARLPGEVSRELARIPAARPSTRQELHRRVLRGKEFLDDSLSCRTELTDAAREACLSPFHFHRAFVAVTGETPHGYLARRRLERATAQLRESTAAVSLIAHAAGFASIPSFSLAFRRRFGLSPQEFRKLQ
jgi:AraC family transcriptional regulator